MTINRNHPQRNLFCRVGRVSWLIVALILCGGTAVFGELVLPEIPTKKKKKDKNEVVIPPQAVPVEVQITPGQEVAIPLKVYGWRGRNVKYLLRTQPREGEVRLVPGEQGVWTLLYRHRGAIPPPEGALDRFFFAAQDHIATSAPAEIRVKVVDFPPRFEMPDRLDFGGTWTGEPLEQKVTVANRGGGVVVGRFFADSPWRVEPEQFQLDRGEEREVTVFFEPLSEQAYQGRMTVSGEQGMMMQLSGEARDAFRVEPLSLDLLPKAGAVEREGIYTLENRTERLQQITIEADPRLGLPALVELPPGGVQELSLQLGEDDLKELKGAVRFSNGLIERSAQVMARPIGVRLFAEGIDFGELEALEPVEKEMVVSNRGGMMANVVATAPPGFAVTPQRFDLDAGAEETLQVTLNPEQEGEVAGVLKLQATGSLVDVPLRAEVNLEVLAGKVAPRTLGPGEAGAEEGSSPQGRQASQRLSASSRLASLMKRPGDPGVPMVTKATIRQVGPEALEMSWEAPGGRSDLDYRLESQRLFRGIDGALQVTWQRIEGVAIRKEGTRATALISGVPPGRTLTAQIVTVSPEGKLSTPSDRYTFRIRPSRPLVTWRAALVAFFVAMGGAALWVRFGRSGLRVSHAEERPVSVP